MIVPWLCLRGCINAACESHGRTGSGLIVADFATGGVDVGLRGAAVGSNIQVCDPDGGQKVLDRSFGPSTRVFCGNDVDEGYGVEMAQAISKMLSVIRMGNSLIVNTKSGQGMILATWRWRLRTRLCMGAVGCFGFVTAPPGGGDTNHRGLGDPATTVSTLSSCRLTR